MTTKSYTKSRFSPNDSALVLIDHQSGIMQLVHDYSTAEFRNNVIALAKLGKVFNLPTVLTTSFSQGPNGPSHHPEPTVLSGTVERKPSMLPELDHGRRRADQRNA